MVNIDNVMQKLRNGLFVGLGVFGSTFVGDALDGSVPGGDMGVAAGQLAVGAGVSVAADEYIGRTSSIPNDVVEHAGYGIQGAAWAELADAVQSGSNSGEVTTVDVREVTRSGSQPNTTTTQRDELSVDV